MADLTLICATVNGNSWSLSSATPSTCSLFSIPGLDPMDLWLLFLAQVGFSNAHAILVTTCLVCVTRSLFRLRKQFKALTGIVEYGSLSEFQKLHLHLHALFLFLGLAFMTGFVLNVLGISPGWIILGLLSDSIELVIYGVIVALSTRMWLFRYQYSFANTSSFLFYGCVLPATVQFGVTAVYASHATLNSSALGKASEIIVVICHGIRTLLALWVLGQGALDMYQSSQSEKDEVVGSDIWAIWASYLYSVLSLIRSVMAISFTFGMFCAVYPSNRNIWIRFPEWFYFILWTTAVLYFAFMRSPVAVEEHVPKPQWDSQVTVDEVPVVYPLGFIQKESSWDPVRAIFSATCILTALLVCVLFILDAFVIRNPDKAVPTLNLTLFSLVMFIHLTVGFDRTDLSKRTFVALTRWAVFAIGIIIVTAIPFIALPSLSIYLSLGLWPWASLLIIATTQLTANDPNIRLILDQEQLLRAKIHDEELSQRIYRQSIQTSTDLDSSPTVKDIFAPEWIDTIYFTFMAMEIIWVVFAGMALLSYGSSLSISIAIAFAGIMICTKIHASLSARIYTHWFIYGVAFSFTALITFVFVALPIVLRSGGVGTLFYRASDDTWSTIMSDFSTVLGLAQFSGIYLTKEVLGGPVSNANLMTLFQALSTAQKTLLLEASADLTPIASLLTVLCGTILRFPLVFVSADLNAPFSLNQNHFGNNTPISIPSSATALLDLGITTNLISLDVLSFQDVLVNPYLLVGSQSRGRQSLVLSSSTDFYGIHGYNVLNHLSPSALIVTDFTDSITKTVLTRSLVNFTASQIVPPSYGTATTVSELGQWILATVAIPGITLLLLLATFIGDKLLVQLDAKMLELQNASPRKPLIQILMAALFDSRDDSLMVAVILCQLCALLSWTVFAIGVSQSLSSVNRLPYGPQTFAYLFTILGFILCVLTVLTRHSETQLVILARNGLQLVVLVSAGYVCHSASTDPSSNYFLLMIAGSTAYLVPSIMSSGLIAKEKSPTTFETDTIMTWLALLTGLSWLVAVIGMGRASADLGASLLGIGHYILGGFGLIGPAAFAILTVNYGPWYTFFSVSVLLTCISAAGATLGHGVYILNQCKTNVVPCTYEWTLLLIGSGLYIGFGSLLFIYKSSIDILLSQLQLIGTIQGQIFENEVYPDPDEEISPIGIKNIPLPTLPDDAIYFIHITEVEYRWMRYKVALVLLIFSWALLNGGFGFLPAPISTSLLVGGLMGILLLPISLSIMAYGLTRDSRKEFGAGICVGFVSLIGIGRMVASFPAIYQPSTITMLLGTILIATTFTYCIHEATMQFKVPILISEERNQATLSWMNLHLFFGFIGWVFLTIGLVLKVPDVAITNESINFALPIVANIFFSLFLVFSIAEIRIALGDVLPAYNTQLPLYFRNYLRWCLDGVLATSFITLGGSFISMASIEAYCSSTACGNYVGAVLIMIGSLFSLSSLMYFKLYLVLYGEMMDQEQLEPIQIVAKDQVSIVGEGTQVEEESVEPPVDRALRVYEIFLIWPQFQMYMKLAVLIMLFGYLIFLVSFVAAPSTQPPFIIYSVMGAISYYFVLKWLRFGTFPFYTTATVTLLISNAASASSLLSDLPNTWPSFSTGVVVGSAIHFLTSSALFSATLAWRSSDQPFLHSYGSIFTVVLAFIGWGVFAFGSLTLEWSGNYRLLDFGAQSACLAFSLLGAVYFPVFWYQYYWPVPPKARFFTYWILLISHGLSGGALVLMSQRWSAVSVGYSLQLAGSSVYFVVIFSFLIAKIYNMTEIEYLPEEKLLEENAELTHSDFQTHWIYSPNQASAKGLMTLLVWLGWLSALAILIGVYLSYGSFIPFVTIEVHGTFVSLMMSLVSYNLYINYKWASAGVVLAFGSLFTLICCGPIVSGLLTNMSSVSIFFIGGGVSAAFFLLTIGLYLVHRPKAKIPERWSRLMSMIFIVVLLGWLAAVAGIAVGVANFTFNAQPIIQYLQVSFPGGLALILMFYVHVWPTHGRRLYAEFLMRYQPFFDRFRATDVRVPPTPPPSLAASRNVLNRSSENIGSMSRLNSPSRLTPQPLSYSQERLAGGFERMETPAELSPGFEQMESPRGDQRRPSRSPRGEQMGTPRGMSPQRESLDARNALYPQQLVRTRSQDLVGSPQMTRARSQDLGMNPMARTYSQDFAAGPQIVRTLSQDNLATKRMSLANTEAFIDIDEVRFHPQVVFLSAFALVMCSTTSLTGYSSPNVPTVLTFVGSILSMIGLSAYLIIVALEEKDNWEDVYEESMSPIGSQHSLNPEDPGTGDRMADINGDSQESIDPAVQNSMTEALMAQLQEPQTPQSNVSQSFQIPLNDSGSFNAPLSSRSAQPYSPGTYSPEAPQIRTQSISNYIPRRPSNLALKSNYDSPIESVFSPTGSELPTAIKRDLEEEEEEYSPTTPKPTGNQSRKIKELLGSPAVTFQDQRNAQPQDALSPRSMSTALKSVTFLQNKANGEDDDLTPVARNIPPRPKKSIASPQDFQRPLLAPISYPPEDAVSPRSMSTAIKSLASLQARAMEPESSPSQSLPPLKDTFLQSRPMQDSKDGSKWLKQGQEDVVVSIEDLEFE